MSITNEEKLSIKEGRLTELARYGCAVFSIISANGKRQGNSSEGSSLVPNIRLLLVEESALRYLRTGLSAMTLLSPWEPS